MRVLITGAGGMLGRDLCEHIAARGHQPIATGRRDGLIPLDVNDLAQTRAVVCDHKPDAIIHCAAWTDVDGAQRDPLGAYKGNALASWNVATVAAEQRCENGKGIWLIAISTDFVFDGTQNQNPYTEFDATNPLGVYGASKLAGERLVRETLPNRSMVVRTSWLYGAHGRNFPATILRLAQKLPEVPVVSDEFGSPTHTRSLAQKLVDLMESPLAGVYHVCDDGVCSRFEMAQAAVALAGLPTPIVPITAQEYAERFQPAARRPMYSAMQRLSLQMRGMDDLPKWQDALAEFVALRTWVP